MSKYNEMLKMLEERLRNGERFGLRTNLEGEGKFKDFQGRRDIAALKQFFENAESVENITVRYENAVEDVISEF